MEQISESGKEWGCREDEEVVSRRQVKELKVDGMIKLEMVKTIRSSSPSPCQCRAVPYNIFLAFCSA